MKRRIIKVADILACMMFCMMTLGGCSGKGAQSDYVVQEVKCMFHYGDRDGAEVDIYNADGSVKQYIITPYSNSGINIFAGEVPSDNECKVVEYAISEDEWNHIADTIKSNDFMKLPEELPKVEANDGSTCYIEIMTSKGNHRSGGYCAGNGTGKEHQRFYNIRGTLKNAIKK